MLSCMAILKRCFICTILLVYETHNTRIMYISFNSLYMASNRPHNFGTTYLLLISLRWVSLIVVLIYLYLFTDSVTIRHISFICGCYHTDRLIHMYLSTYHFSSQQRICYDWFWPTQILSWDICHPQLHH